MTAYNIAGNNFVRLRDIGQQVGFNVYWQNGVQIDTDAPYTGAASVQTISSPPTEMEIREEMIRRINEVRRKRGVPELAVDQSLMDAAQECSAYLYTKHNNRAECETVAASGYTHGFGSNLTAFTIMDPEKIPQKAVANWENSPGHLATMIDPNCDTLGVGVTVDNGRAFCYMFVGNPTSHKHFLPLGGGNQAVAQILLQGGNIFRLQQFRKEAQPVFRCRSISPIGYRQTVAAILFFLCKPTIQKTSAVRHMDTVTLQGQRVCICRQLQRFDYLLHRLCNLGMKPGRDFLINRALQFALIGRWAIHSIKAVVDTAHGMLGQEIPAVFRFDNFPLIINPNRVIHGIAPLSGEPAICGCIRLPLVRL